MYNPKFSVELDDGIQDGTSITTMPMSGIKMGFYSVGTNYTLVKEGIYSVKSKPIHRVVVDSEL
jgi:hypothetical protein